MAARRSKFKTFRAHLRLAIFEILSRFRRRRGTGLLSSKPEAAIHHTRLGRAHEYSEEDDVTYETRVVAFIDILGWSAAVEESEASLKPRKRMLNAVWFIGVKSKQDAEEDTVDYPSFDQATQFSDSIVVSIPYKSPQDIARLIRQVSGYQSIMLSSGFPMIGGITVGSLYHSGSIVFGPALNEAYRLESKLAIHPRIIIAKSLGDQVRLVADTFPEHWAFASADDDGFYSTDYLIDLAVSDSASRQIDSQIERWLSEHQNDEKICQKYIWLRDRWATAKADAVWRVERFRQLRMRFDRSNDAAT